MHTSVEVVQFIAGLVSNIIFKRGLESPAKMVPQAFHSRACRFKVAPMSELQGHARLMSRVAGVVLLTT